jgi:hypothetical protein
LALLGGQVNLGGQPAPRPAEPVICGFAPHAARRLLLFFPFFSRTGGVLVRAP